jgi:uncharacterized membrane-anchored protein
MGREFLKLLLALGTGAISALLAYVSGWVPPETTSAFEYGLITVVIAAVKRGLDYLASKTATPTPTPTETIRR